MENKQTAVEWAEDKLSDLNSAVINGELNPEEYHKIRVNIWIKAKAMEKKHIIDAYNTAIKNQLNRYASINAEEYYNETYISNGKTN